MINSICCSSDPGLIILLPCLSISESDVGAKSNHDRVRSLHCCYVLDIEFVSVTGDMGYSFLLSHSRVKLHAKKVKSTFTFSCLLSLSTLSLGPL